MADLNPSPLPSAPIPDEHTVTPISGAWRTLQSMDFMAIEIQMILSAVLIIYVGAHASLRRPPSAAPPAKRRKRNGRRGDDDQTKEEFGPGFVASDAIMFPLMAATVLIGMYYLIKWLQDPAILNTILRWYMSLTGVFSSGIFLGNALQLVLGLVFPDYWVDRAGRVFKIDMRNRSQKLVRSRDSAADGLHEADVKKRAPFPGPAAALPVSSRMSKALYTIRHLLVEDWDLDFGMWGLGRQTTSFNPTALVGLLLGLLLQGTYLYTNSPMLANVIGLAVSYMACVYMSVTSFLIGSLVLAGLFVYDIIMVFYTPFMVGVATQLDVPIKLTYQTAKRSSILGLGDIVIPGIFICLALRFDLWKHYQRKITSKETELKTVTKEGVETYEDNNGKGGVGSNGYDVAASFETKEVTTVKTAYREVKAPFVDPRGQWGNVFWTTRWLDMLRGGSSVVKSIADGAFPKTYFHATILGYLVGMLTTVGVLLVFRRGQPALLYLVPGVLGSAFITGWWRGEVGDMLKYTENGSLDVEDVVVDVDGDGNVIPKPKEIEQNKGKEGEKAVREEAREVDPQEKDGAENKSEDECHELLYFSITIPREEDLKED